MSFHNLDDLDLENPLLSSPLSTPHLYHDYPSIRAILVEIVFEFILLIKLILMIISLSLFAVIITLALRNISFQYLQLSPQDHNHQTHSNPVSIVSSFIVSMNHNNDFHGNWDTKLSVNLHPTAGYQFKDIDGAEAWIYFRNGDISRAWIDNSPSNIIYSKFSFRDDQELVLHANFSMKNVDLSDEAGFNATLDLLIEANYHKPCHNVYESYFMGSDSTTYLMIECNDLTIEFDFRQGFGSLLGGHGKNSCQVRICETKSDAPYYVRSNRCRDF